MSRLEPLPVRLAVFATWLAMLLGGLLCFKPFMKQLKSGVNPPKGSDSLVAREALQAAFGVPPVMLTAVVRSRSGAPMINRSLGIQIDGPPPYLPVPSRLPFPPYDPIPSSLRHLNISVPDPSTPLSALVANISHELRNLSQTISGICQTSFVSFWDVSQITDHTPHLAEAIGMLAENKFFNDNASSTLMITTISSCHGQSVDANCVGHDSHCEPVTALTDDIKKFAASYSDTDEVDILVTSFPEISLAILGGISTTLDASTMTFPIALLVLAVMLSNARLLLCTLANIICCITSTILIMYPISLSLDVSSEAPSLMIAVALALSIDYSLFLLSRFGEEAHASPNIQSAVDIMLATSGHTVLVSGSTLCLCFLGMLCIPVGTISSMGLAAAVTVAMAIGLALTLTPALLLTFPNFFSATRRFGFSLDGCFCSEMAVAPLAHLSDSLTHNAATLINDDGSHLTGAAANTEGMPRSSTSQMDHVTLNEPEDALMTSLKGSQQARFWARVGSFSQRFSILILLVAIAAVIPFAVILPTFDYVEGVLPMLPRGGEATTSFLTLQEAFGVGSVFPNAILIQPQQVNITTAAWLASACTALRQVAKDVSTALAEQGIEYEVRFEDFTGIMVQQGKCTASYLPILHLESPALWQYYVGRYIRNGATKVQVSLKLNPFSHDGQQWIRAMRQTLADPSNTALVGSMMLSGIGPEQMDGAISTFNAFPLMVLVTLIIVTIVIGIAFRSVVVPIRAAICIVWMLAIVFGAAVLIYQNGGLSWLGLKAFSPQGDALFWMSPCIAFSIVVGLGLDYDVFFTESIIEAYDKGAGAKEAVLIALAHTGNIICAAGIIMAIAFGALFFGSSALNQIAFLLCFGVLVDCFITTKFIIPAICSLLSTKANFWPRTPAAAQ